VARLVLLVAAVGMLGVLGVGGGTGDAGTTAGSARPQPLRLGITDTAAAYYDDRSLFPLLGELNARVLRVHLQWGGKRGVARRRPVDATDPDDPAYDWRIYDRVVLEAAAAGVDVMFTVFGTPAWANGGAAPTRAPRNAVALKEFTYAAAWRYSGEHERRDGTILPPVRLWTAWNEPNLKIGLVPQWKRVGKRWVPQSAVDYARICNAVVDGIRATGIDHQRVACGVTAARGNNNPRGRKPSVSPLAFLRAMKKAGARGFDAYAHHPYYGTPSETPSTRPRGATAVTMGNLDALERELTRLYGPKPIWITEYGYQTNPPDRTFGVSWPQQASYVRQAVAVARKHPRVELLLWFLLKDEEDVTRWQSGFIAADGTRKPAFDAFQEQSAALAADR
jgi:Glycosyl hydrolase catalytic core